MATRSPAPNTVDTTLRPMKRVGNSTTGSIGTTTEMMRSARFMGRSSPIGDERRRSAINTIAAIAGLSAAICANGADRTRLPCQPRGRPMKPTALFAAALLAASALPAMADTSLTAYEASRQALLAIWAELPLTVRNVALTDGPPAGYGDYKGHQGNSFKAGETIEIYAEVLGYGFKD